MNCLNDSPKNMLSVYSLISLLIFTSNYRGIETLSWVCVLGAAPFAALGFIKYNGMTAEKFVAAWIKSMILTPKRLTFKPINLYYEDLKNIENRKVKKERKNKNKEDSQSIENIK